MLTPYYSDDLVTIYHADWRDVIDGLAGQFGILVMDPPYGVGLDCSNGRRGRSIKGAARDYPDIEGDREPFDPAPWLAMGLPMVAFGANHYADRLPASPTWLVWDKLDGLTGKREIGFNDSADVELAWSNLGGPARLYRQRWMGAMKIGRDRAKRRMHPTAKPVELLSWVLAQCPAGVVLDPYMGVGPTLRAAKDRGRPAIGIEVVEAYCEVAAERCSQEVLAFDA